MEPENQLAMRKALVEKINGNPRDRDGLKDEFGEVWNTEELQKDFLVTSFLAPFILVQKKESKETGTLMFQHHPRFYFSWEPEAFSELEIPKR